MFLYWPDIWLNLKSMGISLGILQQVPNFKRCFEEKWGKTQEMLFHFLVSRIFLNFYRTFYWGCTSACRVDFKGKIVGQHCLFWFREDYSYCMKEVWILLPVSKLISTSLEMPVVLKVPKSQFFQPTEQIHMELLSLIQPCYWHWPQWKM